MGTIQHQESKMNTRKLSWHSSSIECFEFNKWTNEKERKRFDEIEIKISSKWNLYILISV